MDSSKYGLRVTLCCFLFLSSLFAVNILIMKRNSTSNIGMLRVVDEKSETQLPMQPPTQPLSQPQPPVQFLKQPPPQPQSLLQPRRDKVFGEKHLQQYNSTAEMIKRRERIKTMCATEIYKKTNSFRPYASLVSLDTVRSPMKDVTYCPVPKSGWTTWKEIFYRHAGITHLMGMPGHTAFNSFWKECGFRVTSNDALPDRKIRMAFFRNPYERLVSAYKNKVLHNNGKYMKGRGHGACPKVMYNKPPEPLLTFKQFISCIVDFVLVKQSVKLDDLTAGVNLDHHWRPEHLLCNVCSEDYNIIGHTEHMEADVKLSLDKLGIRNMSVPHKNNSGDLDKVVIYSLADYYKQLGDTLLSQFRQLYSHDFALLGYDSTPPFDV